MKLTRSILLLPLTAGLGLLLVSCQRPAPVSPVTKWGVRIVRSNENLRVELNGKFFTEYHYENVPKPYCYPVLGPGGVAMTRSFPMEKVPGEATDHPHHRSLWFGHEPVNGVDFWTERAGAGRVVHRGFVDIASGVNTGFFKSLNDWVDATGKVIGTDEETFRFYAPNNGAITFDFEITIKATHGDVTFGDSKEGTFALRVAESMRVLRPTKKDQPARPGGGQIVLSTGIRDNGASAAAAKDAKREAQTWGKRAAWCDYSGPIGTNTYGIAIMDHPANPRHPTAWQVRDYGLFAANPFAHHAYDKAAPEHAGDFKLLDGQTVTFRYRIVLHEGDEQFARIAERYAEYAATGSNPQPR